VALGLGSVTGWRRIDPVFALGIAAALIGGAWRIAGRALDTLMDRELPDDTRDRVQAVVMAHPEVRGMHDLRSRSSGTGIFLQLHVEMDRTLRLDQAHDVADQIEQRLASAFPNAEVIIHQEPAPRSAP